MQLRIPPELRQITKVVTPITGIDKAPNMEHHDPSNIIRYRDRYYLWFTEHLSVHLGNDGFQSTWITVACPSTGPRSHVGPMAGTENRSKMRVSPWHIV